MRNFGIHEPEPPRPRWRAPSYHVAFFIAGVIIGVLAMSLTDCVARAENYTQHGYYAIDGDTFVDNTGTHIRIWGIDAPEKDQVCDGQRVGVMARNRLHELLSLGAVTCQKKLIDRYGRVIAVCIVHPPNQQGFDLGQTLVREGLAFAYRRYTSAYAEDEGWGPVHTYRCANPETVRHK